MLLRPQQQPDKAMSTWQRYKSKTQHAKKELTRNKTKTNWQIPNETPKNHQKRPRYTENTKKIYTPITRSIP